MHAYNQPSGLKTQQLCTTLKSLRKRSSLLLLVLKISSLSFFATSVCFQDSRWTIYIPAELCLKNCHIKRTYIQSGTVTKCRVQTSSDIYSSTCNIRPHPTASSSNRVFYTYSGILPSAWWEQVTSCKQNMGQLVIICPTWLKLRSVQWTTSSDLWPSSRVRRNFTFWEKKRWKKPQEEPQGRISLPGRTDTQSMSHVQKRTTKSVFTSCIDRISDTSYDI